MCLYYDFIDIKRAKRNAKPKTQKVISNKITHF